MCVLYSFLTEVLFLSFFQIDRKWWTRKGQGLKSTAQWWNQLNWNSLKSKSQPALPYRFLTSTFRISLYSYIRVCFSVIFLLMWKIFSLWSSSYYFHGNYILSLSKPKIMTYGLNSFTYFSSKQWSALPDFFRTIFWQIF